MLDLSFFLRFTTQLQLNFSLICQYEFVQVCEIFYVDGEAFASTQLFLCSHSFLLIKKLLITKNKKSIGSMYKKYKKEKEKSVLSQ